MIKPRSSVHTLQIYANKSFANSILDEREFLRGKFCAWTSASCVKKVTQLNHRCFSRLAGLFAEEPFTDGLFY